MAELPNIVIDKTAEEVKKVFDIDVNNISDTIKKTVSGTVVRMDDVSSQTHYLDVEVQAKDSTSNLLGSKLLIYGKNLLTTPYSYDTRTLNGVKFTAYSNGTVRANGTATADARFFLRADSPPEQRQVLYPGIYFMSGCPANGSPSTYYIGGFGYMDLGEGCKLDIKEKKSDWVYIMVKAGTTISATFRPMIEVGSQKTDFEPTKGVQEYTLVGNSYIENINNLKSLYPTTTIISDVGVADVTIKYNKSLEKTIYEINGKTADLETLTAEHTSAIEKLQESITNDDDYEEVTSLEEMTDTSKRYLYNGYIYAYRATGSKVVPLFENLLEKAIDTDGTLYNGGLGYLEGYRISSSGTETEASGCCMTGYISCEEPSLTLRFKNMPQSPQSDYIHYYKDDFSRGSAITYESAMYAAPDENGVYSVTLSSATYTKYIRISAGQMSEDTIITLSNGANEGKIEYEEVASGYTWVNTGLTPETATIENRVLMLENNTARLNADLTKFDERLSDVESGISNLTDDEKLALIRQWDAPIYDRSPVFLLDAEKAAVSSAEKTVDAVYAKYDALMAEHPDFITKTDLGLCSDGVTHVYRYDFREREGRHQSGFEWSETKPKFIVVTGIHREWNGIYSMYNALAEIATNEGLAELRRSVHFIVIPVLNPYSISGEYSVVGHAANYNGVEIHRNFEVGFTVSGQGTIHYTGETALSEVESQYLDNIFKENTDAAYFLTCHSFDRDKTWGVGFLWGSSATKYMCNMAFRVIDKMGKAWHKKYGTTWETGIANANNGYTALDVGDYRIGHAALTNTSGCEQRQATKYGIQATNFEVGETFFVLDETSLSAKAITHGAEAYVNFFLTAMSCYDFKDKDKYYVK